MSEVLLLLALIVLNGLFAMAEIALVTARRARLTAMAAAGSVPARAALRGGTAPPPVAAPSAEPGRPRPSAAHGAAGLPQGP